jgi:hypothetical protein
VPQALVLQVLILAFHFPFLVLDGLLVLEWLALKLCKERDHASEKTYLFHTQRLKATYLR